MHMQAVSFWSERSPLARMAILKPLLERGEEAERFLLHLSMALREHPLRTRDRDTALFALIRDLGTNASRPLLVQRFLLAIGAA